VIKRGFDVVVALTLIILAAPVMLATASALLICLGRPVLFRQVRPGLNGKPFTLLKFRTMRDEMGSDGLPLPDEMRLSRCGSWVRALSLDELPQLINVLRGEMSLVGPRPLLMEYLPLYSPEQARRHDVRPGITGWAQVNGRNAVSWEERFRLDRWYVDNQSFGLDLKILLLTAKKVFLRQGVSSPGHATMAKFTGNGQ
jgi:sugar transferase EpsL